MGESVEAREFATFLRGLKARTARSYEALSRRAGVSGSSLQRYCAGESFPGDYGPVEAFARACGADRDDLRELRRLWTVADLARRRTQTAGRAAARVPPVPSGGGRSPYVGLAAFQPEDADRFHGRDRLAGELLARLARRRFLTVFGASGAGKSSLLRAGLVARVRAGGLDGDRGWPAVVVTPGRYPFEECAIQLAAMTGTTPGQVRAELTDDPHSLHRIICQALAGQPAGVDLVLVVDQFEEVFTLCPDGTQRARFIEALLVAAGTTDSRARVVLGVRADFYTHCSDHPDLVAALTDAQVLVGPMTTEELRQATIEPARQVGCSVDDALLAAIVADAAGQPGALPLVSHALVETWKRRDANTLTLAGYHAAGGIQGALAQTAETLYTTLTPARQRVARDLFVRLTALGEGTEDTKRRIARDEVDADDPDVGAVVNVLVEARLIVLGDTTVEIAHEALIGAWPRLRRWLTTDRESLRTHRQLSEAAQAWTALDRDAGALYRGARLAVAREWAAHDGRDSQLNLAERDFLSASITLQDSERAAAVRRSRQLRYLALGLAVLLLVAIGVSVVAVNQRQAAVHNQQIAVSRQLATQALALIDSEPSTAMLLSVEAYRTAPTIEARSALLSMSAYRAYQAQFAAHTGAVSEVAFGADGRTLVTVGRDQTAAVWDTNSHTRLAALTGHATWLKAMALSPDGSMIATGGDDRDVVLWDAAGHTRVATLTGHTGEIKEIAFSPDGRFVATASADATVALWDVAARTRLATLAGHTGPVNSVVFSPDGRTLATAGADHTVMLWDVAERTRLATLTGHTDEVSGVVFSSDGRTLATSSGDKTVGLWDTATRTQVATLTGHTGWVTAIKFSPDGRTLATASIDATVVLWDVDHRVLRARLTGHTGNIYSLSFHPHRPMLASAGESGSVVLWDLTRPALAGHADTVTDLAYTSDGRSLATASLGQTTLWDTGRRAPRAIFTDSSVFITSLAVSPDGRTVATVTESAKEPFRAPDNTLTLWDAVTGGGDPVKLTGHTDRVLDVAFSPDGRTIATTSVDQTVIIWHAARHTRLATLKGHTQAVNGVAFSPDGRTIATASHDQTVRLWDAATGTQRASMSHPGWTRSVVFSPDGRTLASASNDQTVKLWDVATATNLATLTGHTDAVVNGVAFSPDGNTLVYTAGNNAVLLWDLRSRSPVARLTGHTKPIRSVAYSPDGRTLATASVDQTVILWDTDAGQVASQMCQGLARSLTAEEWHRFVPELPYHKTCETP